MKHDSENLRTPKEKSNGKENQPMCLAFFSKKKKLIVQKGSVCDHLHPHECFTRKKGISNLGVCSQACGKGSTRTKETNTFSGSRQKIGSLPAEAKLTLVKFHCEGIQVNQFSSKWEEYCQAVPTGQLHSRVIATSLPNIISSCGPSLQCRPSWISSCTQPSAPTRCATRFALSGVTPDNLTFALPRQKRVRSFQARCDPASCLDRDSMFP